VSWKAIPDTRPRDSETSVTECVVCAWNNTRSVGRRAQVTSRPCRDQMYVVRQVRRCMTRQRREDKTCQFEVNSTLGWKPVQLAQHWRDVFAPSSCCRGTRETRMAVATSAIHRLSIADLLTQISGSTLKRGPDLQNILRRSYDYLTIMSKLRSTYDRRLIHRVIVT